MLDTVVEDCRAVGPDLGYRDHAHLSSAADGRLGFHRASSHEVVPIDACPVLSPGAQRARALIGDATGAASVTVRTDGTRSVAVVTPGSGPLELPAPDDAPGLDLVLGQDGRATVALRGDGVLVHDVDWLALSQPPGAFFQVGGAAAAALVAEVLTGVGDVSGALVWDLYAGVGLLSLPLARAGAEVIAVEADREAAGAARGNARANGLDLEVITGEVAEFTATAAAAASRALGATLQPPELPLDPPDVVVLDPPRAGAGPDVIGHLVELAPPRIVAVGCDVASAARDLGALVAAGWRLERVVPLHLFPMTHHVELVATLSR
jgi:tRNA/tmRNA/rRNA uracil-C5-methylase (TrmA/RlmC/RlmD family)